MDYDYEKNKDAKTGNDNGWRMGPEPSASNINHEEQASSYAESATSGFTVQSDWQTNQSEEPNGQNANDYYHRNWQNNSAPFEAVPSQEPPKKSHRGLITFLAILGGVLVLTFGTMAGMGLYSYYSNTNFNQDAGTGGNNVNVKLPIAETPEFVPAKENEPLSVREIAEKVKPSVVGIIMQLQNGTGMASGVIITEDGYILTNAHVVEGAQVMTVVLDNEEKTQYTAKLVGIDAATELAVIKIDATGLPVAELGDSNAVAVGDQIVAIGNPGGLQFQNTVTGGFVSAINREMMLDDGRALTLIQHEAAINTGNSGGALVNMYGQVIGINSVKYAPDYYEGLGFAVPMATAKPVVEQIIAQGYVSGRPLLGITGQNVTQSMYFTSGLPMGVYVVSVSGDSDAYKKGIREGDIITGVGETKITSMEELNAQKGKYKAGDTMDLTIYRNGKEFKVSVQLSEAGPIKQ